MQAQKIINLKRIGYVPTLDIEVSNKHHLFYANNIITSNSHAVSYACNAYLSAYAKAHFPRAFFTSYLRYAKEKQRPFEEIHELVQNARLMSIDICGPDFRHLNKHFKLIDKKIYFGFFDIKSVGESVYNKIIKSVKDIQLLLNKTVDKWTWLEFLILFSRHVTSTAITAIINSGAISYMGLSRTRMIYEYNIYNKFTSREQDWMTKYICSTTKPKLELKDILITMMSLPTGKIGACANEKRKTVINSLLTILNKPTYDLKDTAAWISSIEESLFGIPITCTSLDACDKSSANCTCLEYIQEVNPKIVIIAGTINNVNEIKTKTGKNPGQKMAFLKISDITGSIDSVVIFPDVWSQIKSIVFLGNNVLFSGERSKDKSSLIIRNAWQI